jgi:Viral BACON domain
MSSVQLKQHLPLMTPRKVRNSGVLTFLVFLCASTFARPVAASTVLYRTDAELIAQSARVVHARVLGQRNARGGPQGRRIYTVTTLSVIEDFTGFSGDTIEVWELGGTIGDEMTYVAGAAEYRLGEEVLVCLERGPLGLRSVALNFSKFDVVRGADGEARLVRNVHEISVVGGAAAMRERSLAEFRQLAAQVIGRPSRRSALPQGASASPLTSVAQPFTKIVGEPGWRWRRADFGQPVIVYKNTSAPPPLITGDAVTEIQQALAAWTNPTTASIILQYGGTALEAFPDGDWSTIPDDSVLITFEDPEDSLASNVLAIGGGSISTTPGSGGTVGGVTYEGFVQGLVVFQNASALPPSFRQSLDFSRVVEHEIGHTIGFGHTQTDGSVPNPTSSIMFFTCCFDNTPVPPALGPDDLAGLNVVYPAGPASGPTMAFDRTSLSFGAVTSGGAFVWKTSAQTVRLTQSGAGTVSWTATSTQPWLQVTPATGTGAVTFTVSVVSPGTLPVSGIADGAISVTFSGARNTPGPIAVRLTLMQQGTSGNPFGFIDTPANNTGGVTGEIPVTGWALDDVEVANVMICRAAVGAESAPADPNCGGAAQFFVGFGVFIEGSRPDVQATFPAFPRNNVSGWGYMLLTNTLPSQGNGTFVFFAYVRDREGHTVLLGTRTLTCANEDAITPFGTIDTPRQGEVVSGSSYINFGWVLTQQPDFVPFNGSTITVFVDGVSKGHPSYGHPRADIDSTFPGLQNTGHAVGFKMIDTTTLSNGLHTIVWTATDSGGQTGGLGSRYFRVLNGGSPVSTAAGATGALADSIAAPLDRNPILARRGWATDAPWRAYGVSSSGRVVIRGEEIDRFELWLGDHAGERYTGYMRAGGDLASLPVGSLLDATTGRFTWSPGVGFVGSYDLVFVRWAGPQAVAQHNVRIILAPKGSGRVGSQIVIDAPGAQQDVAQPFFLGGWAADLDALAGTGIDTLHVWAYPLSGGPPVFVGIPTYGGARPDVAAVYGDQFRDSGYGLIVDSLPHGSYDLAVFGWSNVSGGFVPAKLVRVTVQ